MVGTRGYLAPEVIGIFRPDDADIHEGKDQSYTTSVDMWALGATAFRMLTNHSVFSEPRGLWNYVVLKRPFPEEQLIGAGTTKLCLHFLADMMSACPSHRPSAETAMSHPWMLDSDIPSQTHIMDKSEYVPT